jgi:hypothetical protein
MRKSTWIVALLGLLSTALFAACHPVLGKPEIVGASASNGVGARVPAAGATDQDQRTVPVDLEAVCECVVTAGHQPGVLLATGLVASDPTRYTQEQIDIALAEDPTCLIALDVLFWPAHQALPEEVWGTEEEERLRLTAVTSVLQMLEVFDVPVVLGLIPAIDHEDVGVVSNERTDSEIAAPEKYDAYRERRLADNAENNRTNWVPPVQAEAAASVHVEAVAQ